MKHLRTVLIFIYAALCVVGLKFASSELWVGIWLIQLIYLVLPMILLSAFDFLNRNRSNLSAGHRFRLLIHFCAVFAFGIGYLIYKSSVASERPMAEKHVWLPLVLAALVYFIPVSIWARSFLMKAFFRGVTTTDSLSNKSLQQTFDPAANSADAESPSASIATEHRRYTSGIAYD